MKVEVFPSYRRPVPDRPYPPDCIPRFLQEILRKSFTEGNNQALIAVLAKELSPDKFAVSIAEQISRTEEEFGVVAAIDENVDVQDEGESGFAAVVHSTTNKGLSVAIEVRLNRFGFITNLQVVGLVAGFRFPPWVEEQRISYKPSTKDLRIAEPRIRHADRIPTVFLASPTAEAGGQGSWFPWREWEALAMYDVSFVRFVKSVGEFACGSAWADARVIAEKVNADILFCHSRAAIDLPKIVTKGIKGIVLLNPMWQTIPDLEPTLVVDSSELPNLPYLIIGAEFDQLLTRETFDRWCQALDSRKISYRKHWRQIDHFGLEAHEMMPDDEQGWLRYVATRRHLPFQLVRDVAEFAKSVLAKS